MADMKVWKDCMGRLRKFSVRYSLCIGALVGVGRCDVKKAGRHTMRTGGVEPAEPRERLTVLGIMHE